MEGIHGNVWGVSAVPRPCRGHYVQEHTEQHKPLESVAILLNSIGYCNIVNAVLQTIFRFKSKGVRSEVNLAIVVF